MKRLFCLTLLAFALARPVSGGQGLTIQPSDVMPFMGTWVVTMTEPYGFHETVRIWDKGGIVVASVHTEQQVPQDVSGIFKDGDMLVLTLIRFENGQPIWAVIALTLEGETMKMAQMLERSQTTNAGNRQEGIARFTFITGGAASLPA